MIRNNGSRQIDLGYLWLPAGGTTEWPEDRSVPDEWKGHLELFYIEKKEELEETSAEAPKKKKKKGDTI